MEATTDPWGPKKGQALKEARLHLGDTQDDCAERIALHAGGEPVRQGTVYSWEKGRHSPSAANRIAIAQYIEDAAAKARDGAGVSRRRIARRTTHRAPAAADPGLTNPLTGERELSERQAALIDMINREAPHIDDAGMMAIRFNARVLGLGEYLDSN